MTTEVRVDLRCDGEGCSLLLEGISDHRPNNVYARQRAATFGWKQRALRDYCPECAATIESTKRNRVDREMARNDR